MTQADRISRWANVPLPLAKIVSLGCSCHRIPARRVRSNSRKPELVEVRRWIAFRARAMGYGYSVIGRALNRDHSTIMAALGDVRK